MGPALSVPLSTSHTKHPAPTSSHPKLNSVCWVTGMQALLAGSKQAATNTYSSVEGTETGEKHTESAHLYQPPGFLRSHITIIRNPFLPHCLAVATAPTSFCGGKAEASTDPPGAAATGLTLLTPVEQMPLQPENFHHRLRTRYWTLPSTKPRERLFRVYE